MELRLRDGSRVEIRPIRPDDKELLADGYSHLSPETQRRRFLTAKPRLSSSDLRYLTEVDGERHVALVAVPADGPDAILAVGRFVRDARDPASAEFAIVVADQYQGRGLGRELARLLAAEARSRGIRRFTAVVLADNVAVRRLMATIGYGLADRRPAGGVHEVVAELAA